MKGYFHKKEIEVPYYRTLLIIVLTNDYERMKEFYPEYKEDDLFATTSYITYYGVHSVLVVLNFHSDVDVITNGIIAHEALHASNFVFDAICAPSDYDNDEPLAYLIKWITDQIHSFVAQEGFKIAIEDLDILTIINRRKMEVVENEQ